MRKIEVNNQGLLNVISLIPPVAIPITFGRHEHQRMKKADVHIVERLANKLMHFGKRYAKNTGRMGGKKARIYKTIEAALDILSLETGKNPVELLVKAVENASPNEDTTRIVYGGVVYHVSVDVSSLKESRPSTTIYSRGGQRVNLFQSAVNRRGAGKRDLIGLGK